MMECGEQLAAMAYVIVTDAGRLGQKEWAAALASHFGIGLPKMFHEVAAQSD